MEKNEEIEKQYARIQEMVKEMFGPKPKPVLKPNEYQCAKCKEIFEKGWSDEEAHAEKEKLFPQLEPEDEAIICDECFKEIFN